MGLFSRRKAEPVDALDSGDAIDLDTDLAVMDEDLTDGGVSVPPGDGTGGPFDRSVVEDDADYLNLGSIWLKGQTGMELRLEINEQEQQITGVTAVLGESAVQLQAFAAPRTEGVWIDIRNEIAGSIVESGGTAEVVSGTFGEELLTRMPQAGPDGRTVFMPARFVGVDGPRWFLRAVISGRAAIEPAAAEPLHEVIRTIVIDRGEDAMPPRELLPLRLPDATPPPGAEDGSEIGSEAAEGGDGGGPVHVDDLNPFERGPEITEVR